MNTFMNNKLLMLLGVFVMITFVVACDVLPDLENSQAISDADRGLNFTVSGGGNNLLGTTAASTYFSNTAQRLIPNWSTTDLGVSAGTDIIYRIDMSTNPVGTQGITQTISAWPTIVEVSVDTSNAIGIEISIPAGVVEGTYFLNAYVGGDIAGVIPIPFYINNAVAGNVNDIANDLGTGITYWGYEGDYNFIHLGAVTRLDTVSTVASFTSGTTARENFNGDVSKWDTSNITDMGGMFGDTNAFNQDISSWDMSNVINVASMFENARAFNQDISSWNVSSVQVMEKMFHNAVVFNQDISSWNVGSVTNMTSAFHGAVVFNQNIGSWNTSSVRSTNSMFEGASAFNQNLSSWVHSTASGVTVTSTNMFLNATSMQASNKASWMP